MARAAIPTHTLLVIDAAVGVQPDDLILRAVRLRDALGIEHRERSRINGRWRCVPVGRCGSKSKDEGGKYADKQASEHKSLLGLVVLCFYTIGTMGCLLERNVRIHDFRCKRIVSPPYCRSGICCVAMLITRRRFATGWDFMRPRLKPCCEMLGDQNADGARIYVESEGVEFDFLDESHGRSNRGF